MLCGKEGTFQVKSLKAGIRRFVVFKTLQLLFHPLFIEIIGQACKKTRRAIFCEFIGDLIHLLFIDCIKIQRIDAMAMRVKRPGHHYKAAQVDMFFFLWKIFYF